VPLVVVATLLPHAARLPAQQVFRAQTEVVHLPVIVTARDGHIVRGLKAEDFEVKEDDQVQRIAFFTEGASGESLPLHLGLLLDASESMARDIKDAADAAVRFVNALEETQDVTFVDFDTSVSVGLFEPESYTRLFERIRARKPGGGTALHDAVAVYVEGALHRTGQHVLLIYSDGGEARSRTSFNDLQKLLRTANVLIYAVGYLQNQLSAAKLSQQMTLSRIVDETGGEAFFPTSPREIHEMYAKILDELISRYTIGYVPSNRTPDGKFREVEVRVVRPDVRNAKVRTRSGYMAPKQ
jgi:Ca-activated chloride channel family protein